MKKIISFLLAIIMMFSVLPVAFAEEAAEETTTAVVDTEETTAEAEGTEEEPLLGDLDWLLDLPFWTVKPAFKIAKIALKLVKAFVKVGMALGLIDSDEIIDQIIDLIASSQGTEEETTAPVEDTTAAEESTAPAAA